MGHSILSLSVGSKVFSSSPCGKIFSLSSFGLDLKWLLAYEINYIQFCEGEARTYGGKLNNSRIIRTSKIVNNAIMFAHLKNSDDHCDYGHVWLNLNLNPKIDFIFVRMKCSPMVETLNLTFGDKILRLELYVPPLCFCFSVFSLFQPTK